MATEHSDPSADADIGGDASASGQAADPVAVKGKAGVQAGGPLMGDPGALGSMYGSGAGEGTAEAKPSGTRADSSDAISSNDVAPLVHTSMDDVVREVEAKASKLSRG